MFSIHVDITLAPNSAEAFDAVFRDIFLPAIEKQVGFSHATLLRSRRPERQILRLVIVFQSEKLQKRWAISDAHGLAWSKMQPYVVDASAVVFDVV